MKFWLFPLLLVLAAGQACNKRVPPPAALKALPHVDPQPETPIATPSTAATVLVIAPSPVVAMPEPPPPPAPPALAVIDEGEEAYLASDYARAVSRYEEYLKLAPTGDRRDQALFQLGMIYALHNPQKDWSRAMTYFKELMTQHPNSRYQPMAELVALLRNDLMQVSADRDRQAELARRLAAEVERLKRIGDDQLRRGP